VYARVIHFAGAPADVERGVAAYREQVLPYVREATGFRGQTVLVDPETGRAMGITLWATEEAMRHYEELGSQFRTLLAETWDTPVTAVETYEVVVFEPGA
jgi:hypothetical protein